MIIYLIIFLLKCKLCHILGARSFFFSYFRYFALFSLLVW